MNAFDNPLVRNRELERVIAGGRNAIVDYFMDMRPGEIGRNPNECFRRALNQLEKEWLSEALRIAKVLRDTNDAMPRATEEEQRQAALEALEDASALFRTRMFEMHEEILSQACARLEQRADAVEVQVYRDRIEIVDLVQSQKQFSLL